ncbi:MAG TPA: glycosyltransferase family 39 protein [Elusimicrobiota bacterium]|nr:glycosyltransferase family 39 protein [Elusimicrobiota bacterium]
MSLGLIGILFFFFTTYRLCSPSFLYNALSDELYGLGVLWRNGIGPWIQGYLGRDGLHLYHGHIARYFYAGVFYLFGSSWPVVRIVPAVLGVITIVFTYLFLRELVHRRVALLAVFLLGIHPTFILGTKLGSVNVSYLQTIMMGTLYLLACWMRRGGTLYLYAAMIGLGLGVASRIWFIWCIVALVPGLSIYWKNRGFGPWNMRTGVTIIVALGLFSVFPSMMMKTEIHQGFDCLKKFAARSRHPDQKEYPARIGRVSRELHLLMKDGFDEYTAPETIEEDAEGRPCRPLGSFTPFFFWGALALLCMALTKKDLDHRDGKLFIVVVVGMLLFQIFLPGREPNRLHLFIIYPFPQIILAIACDVGYRIWMTKYWMRTVFLGLMVLFVAGEVNGVRYYMDRMRHGDNRYFCKAIYDAAGYLNEGSPKRPGLTLLMMESTVLNTVIFLLNEKGRLKYDFGDVDGQSLEKTTVDYENDYGEMIYLDVSGFDLDEKRVEAWAQKNRFQMSPLGISFDDGTRDARVRLYSLKKSVRGKLQ